MSVLLQALSENLAATAVLVANPTMMAVVFFRLGEVGGRMAAVERQLAAMPRRHGDRD